MQRLVFFIYSFPYSNIWLKLNYGLQTESPPQVFGSANEDSEPSQLAPVNVLVNMVLSILIVDYPVDEVVCYVSYDVTVQTVLCKIFWLLALILYLSVVYPQNYGSFPRALCENNNHLWCSCPCTGNSVFTTIKIDGNLSNPALF